MFKGSCHCGTIGFTAAERPEWLTECNCSICRRIGALWAHYPLTSVAIDAPGDATIAYVQGDRTLAMQSCKRCGCTTHWLPLKPDEIDRMSVNFRMCDPTEIDDIPVRHFDGADTWKFLD